MPNFAAAVAQFLDQVEAALKRGDATEQTYRPFLKTLLEACVPHLVVTNEPRRVACGAPDMQFDWRNVPSGHLEAKDIGIDLANIVADSERSSPRSREGRQLARYRAALPRLLFTDGLEWHWFDDSTR